MDARHFLRNGQARPEHGRLFRVGQGFVANPLHSVGDDGDAGFGTTTGISQRLR